MALSHVSKLFAVKDAKIGKLTADPDGGTTTYATLVDVPGIRTVSISGDVNTTELRGDQVLLDSDSTLQNITVTFEYAKLSLDVFVATLGGAVADASPGAGLQTATYSLLGTDTLFNSFKFEAQVTSVDTPGGDAHLILYKCRLASFPQLGTELDDYQTFTIDATATPRLSDEKWIDVKFNETAAAIA